MKHVWIVNHYANPPSSAGGTRHFHFAEYLKDYGWSASIISASVEHQTGLQRLQSGENYRIEKYKSIPFLWLKTPTYTGNKIRRVLNIAVFFMQAIRPSLTKKLSRPDIIIGSSVHPLAALAGLILSRRFGVPFIFEVRDLWPQTLVDMGRLKPTSLIVWLLRTTEIWLYQNAARIVVLLPHAWEYIAPLGIPKNKIVWIPNGVDLTLFPKPMEVSASSTFNLMYFGAHGTANGLDSLLLGMDWIQRTTQNSQIQLRLVGDGPCKSKLIKQAKQLNLTNISFESPVPKNQIPKLASQADAFILLVLDLPNLYKYGISMNKMFDYLAASRPVILVSNAANNPIADAHAGLTISPGNHVALAKTILKIATTSLDERNRMGQAGREYVEKNYDYKKLTGNLATILNEAASKKI